MKYPDSQSYFRRVAQNFDRLAPMAPMIDAAANRMTEALRGRATPYPKRQARQMRLLSQIPMLSSSGDDIRATTRRKPR